MGQWPHGLALGDRVAAWPHGPARQSIILPEECEELSGEVSNGGGKACVLWVL